MLQQRHIATNIPTLQIGSGRSSRGGGPTAWSPSRLPLGYVRERNIRVRPALDTVGDLRASLDSSLKNGFDPSVDRLTLVVPTGSFVFRRDGWVTVRPNSSKRRNSSSPASKGKKRCARHLGLAHAEYDDEATRNVLSPRRGIGVPRAFLSSGTSDAPAVYSILNRTPLSCFGLPSLSDPDGHPDWGWAHETRAPDLGQPLPVVASRRSYPAFIPSGLEGPWRDSGGLRSTAPEGPETTVPSDLPLLPLPRLEVQYAC